MFVEHKEVGEVTKITKLSQAIRKGLPLVQEDRGRWTMCALGAAFAGVYGRLINVEEMENFVINYRESYHGIADAIGFPRGVCKLVHERHHFGRMRAAELADWLESQGQ